MPAPTEIRGLKVDSFQCRNHPEREGVGICVACRQVFCIECSTKIDGINHCKECLGKRARTAVASTKKASGWFARGVESIFALAVVGSSVFAVAIALVLVGESRARGSGTARVENDERLLAVCRALREYRRDVNAFPTDAEGLTALRRRPPSVSNWHGPYLDASFAPAGVVTDRYGQPVVYRAPTAADPGCVVASMGGDHQLDTDVQNAKKLVGSTNGQAAAEGDDVVFCVE